MIMIYVDHSKASHNHSPFRINASHSSLASTASGSLSRELLTYWIGDWTRHTYSYSTLLNAFAA